MKRADSWPPHFVFPTRLPARNALIAQSEFVSSFCLGCSWIASSGDRFARFAFSSSNRANSCLAKSRERLLDASVEFCIREVGKVEIDLGAFRVHLFATGLQN